MMMMMIMIMIMMHMIINEILLIFHQILIGILFSNWTGICTCWSDHYQTAAGTDLVALRLPIIAMNGTSSCSKTIKHTICI